MSGELGGSGGCHHAPTVCILSLFALILINVFVGLLLNQPKLPTSCFFSNTHMEWVIFREEMGDGKGGLNSTPTPFAASLFFHSTHPPGHSSLLFLSWKLFRSELSPTGKRTWESKDHRTEWEDNKILLHMPHHHPHSTTTCFIVNQWMWVGNICVPVQCLEWGIKRPWKGAKEIQ